MEKIGKFWPYNTGKEHFSLSLSLSLRWLSLEGIGPDIQEVAAPRDKSPAVFYSLFVRLAYLTYSDKSFH